MSAKKTPPDWMKRGVLVEYRPPILPGIGGKDWAFTGRLESDPFLMGNPKYGRWMVRIGDMDENYQQNTGRKVHSLASIDYVYRMRRGSAK